MHYLIYTTLCDMILIIKYSMGLINLMIYIEMMQKNGNIYQIMIDHKKYNF